MNMFHKVKTRISDVYQDNSSKRRNFLLLSVLFWGIIFFIFYLNTFHEKYPDEFDNILGGKLILQGIFPYSGFFSHHGPVAYIVASIIQIFSGYSFVAFRICYAIFLFTIVFGTYILLRKSIGSKETSFYYVFAFLLGCASTYYWMHMLIADSLSAFLILPVFGLLFLKAFFNKSFSLLDLCIISLFAFLTVLSAVTYIYVVGIMYLFTLFLFYKNNKPKIISRRFGFSLLVFLVPPIIFLFYLLLTQSFSEYIEQSLIFNQRYYIYNYPGAGENGINPLRYGVITIQNFAASYQRLFVQIPHFNFAFPVNVTLALGNMVLFAYLLFLKRYSLSFFVLFIAIFSNMRSDPLSSAEKDYQAAVYIITSLFSLCFVMLALYKDSFHQSDVMKRVIFTALFLLLSGYFLATGLYLYERGSSKAFAKYMGTAPKIYDRPEIAPILNQVLQNDEKVWIGPLEFEEMYYLNGDLASKYHFLIPGMGRSEMAREEIVLELNKSKPNFIWFDKNYFILGENPSKYAPFFVDFLSLNYTPVKSVEIDGETFISAVPGSERINVGEKLYVRTDDLEHLIGRLIQSNIIKKAE